MARSRMVRFVQNTSGTTFKMEGYRLTERAKQLLRKRGFKTGDKTWYEVFKSCDVVYRWNPDTGTSDVYIGRILEAEYANRHGKRVMAPIVPQFETAGTLTEARLATRGEFIISRDEAKRIRSRR